MTMEKKDPAVLQAHAAITHRMAVLDLPRETQTALTEGLSDVLEKLYDNAAEQARFDYDSAMLAYRFATRINDVGPKVVAERLGITVEELAHQVRPESFQEMTLTELRLLALASESLVEYDVMTPDGVRVNIGDNEGA